MNPILKLAVLVTVLSFFISKGAFIIPLMQDPFIRQHVDASNVTELEEGFLLEYELPHSSYEFSGAALSILGIFYLLFLYLPEHYKIRFVP